MNIEEQRSNALHWARPGTVSKSENPGHYQKKYKNRRFGGPRPDTPKLVKNYKIEDPDGLRKIIEKLYPERALQLENYQKIIPEA